MNKMNEKLDSTQDCGEREATRLENCMYSLVDINTRIDNLNSQHYNLFKKLDVDYDDGSVCNKEPKPEISTGLLRDIESIINEITNKVDVLENDLYKLKYII